MFEGSGEDRLALLDLSPQSKRQRRSSGNGESAEQGYRRVKVEVERAEAGDQNSPFWSGVRLARASDAQRDRLQQRIRCDQIENRGQGGKGMFQLEVDEMPELENLGGEVNRGKAQIL